MSNSAYLCTNYLLFDLSENIVIQRKQLEQGNPKLSLHSSCRIGDGIVALSAEERSDFVRHFDEQNKTKELTFFIPASGSGSRMFGFLYEYLHSSSPSTETVKSIERLIQRISDFAFYSKLPQHYRDQLETGDVNIKGLIELILTSKGFDYGSLPKGLIPFHSYPNDWKNPFQEHISQGSMIGSGQSKFHFTINKAFEDRIKESILLYEKKEDVDCDVSFSEQDPETNAYAFGDNLTPVKNNEGVPVRRPAGHGALLKNLDQLDADVIFIRNIDNIQHLHKSEQSIAFRKCLAGVLLNFQEKIFPILEAIKEDRFEPKAVQELNEAFDLRMPVAIMNEADQVFDFLNRPIRVCGVVKNEGQAGGGPFWVEEQEGGVSRQIVEKAQISQKTGQLDILIKSTHFNPVELICGVRNYQGKKFNLAEFVNPDLYFIVNKTHEGKSIRYIEKPGLWNGGMANWLTLFYEIDGSCFSPVKTVLDLLNEPHRP